MIYGWSPQISDPTIWGWLTVVNYFGAFSCAAWAVRIDRRRANFWIFVSLIMLALGINKQLDLQALLTVVGREIALQDGWYQDRRVFQKWFIELVTAASLAMVPRAEIEPRPRKRWNNICLGWRDFGNRLL